MENYHLNPFFLYIGSCTNRTTFGFRRLTNGNRLVYQSGQINDFETRSSSLFGYKSGYNLPTNVTIILGKKSYESTPSEGIYVENAYIVASYYRKDYSKDFTPILEEQVIQKYEYPESKGNPFLKRANGLVLELVKLDVTPTAGPSPTTVAPSSTTVAPSFTTVTPSFTTVVPSTTDEARS